MAEHWHFEYDNHGNGSFSEWWDIFDSSGTKIATVYDEETAKRLTAFPDLVEGCDAAWNHIANVLDPGLRDGASPSIIMALELAISKARGE